MSKASLIGGLSLAAYITRICNRNPNLAPTTKNEKDSLLQVFVLIHAREYILLGLAVAHIFVTSSYPPRPSIFCPNPSVLNPQYFTWTRYVKVCLTTIYLAGALRIAAFRSLGKDFTFELAKPGKLITSGIYAYCQHPSYFPDLLITLSNAALFANLDGWLGTFLPPFLVEKYVQYKYLALSGLFVVWVGIISRRIKEEEEMLKETFGKEWEEWHRKTARLIPGIY